jgi:hypothetical protein
MADLNFSNPSTTEGFRESLALLDVKLPLRLCDEYPGSVLDDAGLEILVVDQNSELDDELVSARALMIVLAVNTCGGFKAERADG